MALGLRLTPTYPSPQGTTMKKLFETILLFGLTTGTAFAGYFYVPIPYYNNDPFTFCTYGVPEDCWYPISKELGTYGITSQYCFNIVSASLFAEVCPHAFPKGGASAKTTTPKRDELDLSP
jgi:hypothetical protein